MKKVIHLVIAVLLSANFISGQTPHAINYQVIARDTSGSILINQDISLKITILKDSITGPAVYQEIHSVETNSYGLIRLAIGTGTVISGTFSQIGWDITKHYLNIEIDPDAGDNYNDLGTTQLISVPYALESKHTSSLTLTDENGRKYAISVDTKGTIIAEREWLCGDTLNDARDLQFYPTVQIGNQCWMAGNLNIGTMINSTQSGYQQSNNGIFEKYCYDNDQAQCNTYGGLYEWREAMQYVTSEGAQGICPDGWHIPTDGEWTILTDYLGGSDVAGGPMKSTGTLEDGTGLWQSPNTGATNSSGFTALPGGQRYDDYGFFFHLSGYTFFWSSTESKDWLGNAWYRSLNYHATEIIRYYYECDHGISIRCLRDCAPQPTQSDAGPYQLNLQDTSTTLDGNVPSVGTGVWHIVSGTGGIISDTLNPSSGFQGLAGNFYTLSWIISTVCRSSVDSVLISFAYQPHPCPDSTVTYEGQIYNTVQIGIQCWLKENLNVGTMITSDSGGQLQTDNGVIEKYCLYNNWDPCCDNCDTYGGLYEWGEAMQYDTTEGVQGICPAGWHIPTNWEWTLLANHLGGASVAGGKMKTTGTIQAGTGLWVTPNLGATNESNFTGLPVGARYHSSGMFANDGYYGFFWSSSQNNTNFAWSRNLDYNETGLLRNNYDKASGYSIRCLRDCDTPPSQSDAGPDQLNIQGTSTLLAGNTPVSGTGIWHIVNGSGGTFADTLSPTSEFQGLPGSIYSLTWTISTACAISEDTVVISFADTIQYCPGIPTVDYEGQIYHTVLIGVRCWLKENLNVGTMIYSYQGGQLQTDNDTIEKYCYGNDTAYCDIYGGLYEWKEAMQYDSIEGAQGICPAGWHIPTDDQMTMLANSLGGPNVAGGKLKSTGTIEDQTGLWYAPNTGATNISGFTGLPGGHRKYDNGDIEGLGWGVGFWSSTMKNSVFPWARGLSHNSASVNRGATYKAYGYSIRCIMDCTPETTQSNAGPDQMNIPGTATALQGNAPVTGTGVWHLVSGDGGIIADTLNRKSEFQGLALNTYTLTWTISSACGSSTDTVKINFSDVPSCPDNPTVIYEGQTYHTVLIHTQCWLKENLNLGTMINSNLGGQLQTDNDTIEKYCYGNDSANCDIYGGLYEWREAMQYVTTEGAQGICPDGWHFPSDGEWTTLTNFLGGASVAGGKMKTIGTIEAGTGLWHQPNYGATNESGFTALPTGERYDNGTFNNLGYGSHFWSSSQVNSASAWWRSISRSFGEIFRNSYYKEFGYSVRCVKNN